MVVELKDLGIYASKILAKGGSIKDIIRNTGFSVKTIKQKLTEHSLKQGIKYNGSVQERIDNAKEDEAILNTDQFGQPR